MGKSNKKRAQFKDFEQKMVSLLNRNAPVAAIAEIKTFKKYPKKVDSRKYKTLSEGLRKWIDWQKSGKLTSTNFGAISPEGAVKFIKNAT